MSTELVPQQPDAHEHIERATVPAHSVASQNIPTAWERTTCRACLETALVEVLNLGDQPPANAFLSAADLGKPEARYPLSIRLCESCGMVQLAHVVPPELLFRRYLFFTSSSLWMAEHFGKMIGDAAAEFVPPGGLIVEIGSNDGTTLAAVERRDARRLGIDPARNIAVMAAARGIPTIAEFFTAPLAAEVAGLAGQAHLIIACNVLGHIDDLDDVCAGVRTLLHPQGAFVLEVPYLASIIERNEYDTIYHEHLSYFAVGPLAILMQRHGMRVDRVELHPVHGGTIRVTVRHGAGRSDVLASWLMREAATGLARRSTFVALAQRAADSREQLHAWMTQRREAGERVVGYGAPAKGTVRLNYCGIGMDLMQNVIDSTPAKQGLHVPGTHQVISSPAALATLNPDYLLLMAWNHASEIVARESAFMARGGRIFTPWQEELR